MASLETAIQPGEGDAGRKAEFAEFAALAPVLRRHISFEEVSVHKADLFGDKLGEADLATLVADLGRPELNAALALQQAADADLQFKIAEYIGTLGNAESAPSAQKPNRKKPGAKS